jgi:cyclic pyranopterin phosphate synthase
MAERTIPIADHRSRVLPAPRDALAPPGGRIDDRLGRRLRDLRISVTDRCNFRCTYCMPKEVFDKDYPYLPHRELLTFEEIARLARLFIAHGVQKIRITGGEPLLRKDVEKLVAMLAGLRTLAGGPPDLTLTTNGSLLARKAQALKDAGLKRVTVSLDALDDAVFRRMNDRGFPVRDVLAGIEAAERAGLAPIKVNMVVQRGVNDGEILPMARHFRGSGIVLRFIEFMDVGETNHWNLDQVVPSAQVRRRIEEVYALRPLEPAADGETAERWAYADGAGEVGFISSVTQAFCRDCNRARLSTQGQLYLCLFATQGYDLRALLRGGASDDEIAGSIGRIWQQRADRYSELRGRVPEAQLHAGRRVEMSYIGG